MERAAEQTDANLKTRYGLDQPLWTQYSIALRQFIQGDFGVSLSFQPGVPVKQILAASMPASLLLGFLALLIALALGGGIGAFTGWRRGSGLDQIATVISLTVVSASIIVISALARKLLVGRDSYFVLGGFDSLHNMTLPVVTLGVVYAALFQRLIRANVAAQMAAGLRAGAMARGVPERVALRKYLLPQALVPMLEYMGTTIAGILTGSFVVETIFEVPGVAACFVQGAQARDYPLVIAAIMVYTVLLVALNFVFEMLHLILDPRHRSTTYDGGTT
jgi:oligopeptide transport system permease protein